MLNETPNTGISSTPFWDPALFLHKLSFLNCSQSLQHIQAIPASSESSFFIPFCISVRLVRLFPVFLAKYCSFFN